MYIVIDTNIFFNNWFLESPLFIFLANFSNNTHSTLLIPSVVREEIENKYNIGRDNLRSELDKLNKEFRDFKLDVNIEENVVSEQGYNFQKILESKFNSVEMVPYSNVKHEILVHKAMHSLRPFREKEKGYRDSLIWLSILDCLKSKKNQRRLCFVTGNSNDFFENKNNSTDKSVTLHSDLVRDIAENEIENQFQLYVSLKAFVDENIDKTIHDFNHEEFRDSYGDLLEESVCGIAIEYLNGISVQEFRSIFSVAGYPRTCMNLVDDFIFQDFEGVEDPEIVRFSKIADGKIFIEYRFNLLTVIFNGKISRDNYFENKVLFDKYFQNINHDDAVITIESFPRIYFDASIIFDPVLVDIVNVSIDDAAVRFRY